MLRLLVTALLIALSFGATPSRAASRVDGLKQKLRKNPRSAKVRVALAREFMKAKRPESAVKVMKPLLAGGQKHPTILYTGAVAYARAGDKEAARGLVDRVLKVKPDHVKARRLGKTLGGGPARSGRKPKPPREASAPPRPEPSPSPPKAPAPPLAIGRAFDPGRRHAEQPEPPTRFDSIIWPKVKVHWGVESLVFAERDLVRTVPEGAGHFLEYRFPGARMVFVELELLAEGVDHSRDARLDGYQDVGLVTRSGLLYRTVGTFSEEGEWKRGSSPVVTATVMRPKHSLRLAIPLPEGEEPAKISIGGVATELVAGEIADIDVPRGTYRPPDENKMGDGDTAPRAKVLQVRPVQEVRSEILLGFTREQQDALRLLAHDTRRAKEGFQLHAVSMLLKKSKAGGRDFKGTRNYRLQTPDGRLWLPFYALRSHPDDIGDPEVAEEREEEIEKTEAGQAYTLVYSLEAEPREFKVLYKDREVASYP